MHPATQQYFDRCRAALKTSREEQRKREDARRREHEKALTEAWNVFYERLHELIPAELRLLWHNEHNMSDPPPRNEDFEEVFQFEGYTLLRLVFWANPDAGHTLEIAKGKPVLIPEPPKRFDDGTPFQSNYDSFTIDQLDIAIGLSLERKAMFEAMQADM